MKPHIRSRTCSCTGKSGQHKARFLSRQGAVDEALRRGWAPQTYACPTGSGYHLTHGRTRRKVA